MSDWKKVKLEEICDDISYGYTASATNDPVGPKFLRITDIANGRLCWETVPYCSISVENSEKYLLKSGNIVIARTGATTGVTYTIKPNDPTPVVFASYLIRCKINEDLASPFFMDFVLSSYYWKGFVEGIKGGSAQPGANAKQFADFEFLLPSLAEQKAIAEVLSSLDDKIDLLHRQNKTLETLAEAIFRQTFIEQSNENWEEGTITDLAEHFKKTIKPQHNKNMLFNHYSIPSYDGGKKPDEELGGEIKSNKYEVPSNCILFSKLNPHKDKRVWLLQDDLPENPICSTEFQIVYPRNKDSLYFLYGWLAANKNYREISSGVGGTSGSHQRIKPSEIFDFRCPIISSEELMAYNLEIASIYKKQFCNQTQIQTLEKLRDTLLPKLMSGKVRVKI